MPLPSARLPGRRAACCCTPARPAPGRQAARRHCGRAECLWQKLTHITATVLSERASARLKSVKNVDLLAFCSS